MSISTVAELGTAVEVWLNREGDPSVTDHFPEWLALLEADLRRELRYLTAAAALSIDSNSVALPADVGALRNLRFNEGTPRLEGSILPRTVDQLNSLRGQFTVAGRPRYYAVVNRAFLFVPEIDRTYTAEIIYQRAYVPVATSPALIALAPDLYLYGTLLHAAPFLEHDERLPIWEKFFDKARDSLNLQWEREEFSLLNRQPQRLPRVFGRRP